MPHHTVGHITLRWAAASLACIRGAHGHAGRQHSCTSTQSGLSSPQCLQLPCEGAWPTDAAAGAEHGVVVNGVPANQHVHAAQQDAVHHASSLQAEVHLEASPSLYVLHCVRQGKAWTSTRLQHGLPHEQSQHVGYPNAKRGQLSRSGALGMQCGHRDLTK